MNFSEHWNGLIANGLPDTPANRTLSADGWDSALCAVQAIAFDEQGRMRPAEVICAALSSLHTWNKEP